MTTMSPKKKDTKPELGSVDPSSFSNPAEIQVTDIALFWNIDFQQHVLTGKANLKCQRKPNANTNSLVLDVRDIKISRILDISSGLKLDYVIGEPVGTFGSYLQITLPSEDPYYNICIEYETSPSASALLWLEPEQTLGKEEPFVFSQCQAIQCRSIVPCQDTPSVKFRYTAEVTAPKQLTVLMSAIKTEEPTTVLDGKLLWKFEQKVPIPSYLIALAAGRLKGKLLGLKSMVYAEPELIEKCAYEFAETDKMLKTAVQICGEYVWDRYDLLVLPPSFAFGGMENPCMTFVTPTVLAGDRSLAGVVAHEVSHSWTGNLVTTATFEHFWLNEGFTTFIERKIKGALYGEPHRHFHAILGLDMLADAVIKTLGKDNPLTCLVPNLKNVDPEDAFSVVPYEKGHTFLFYLEQLLGADGAFDKFLKSYLEKFKYQSITTDDFKNYLYEFFKDKKDELDKIDWNGWLYTPGMPPAMPAYDRTLVQDSEELVKKWLSWEPTDECLFGTSQFAVDDIEKFTSGQICLFLSKLLEEEALPVVKIKLMTQVYQFEKATNSEIRFRWLRLCLKAHWKDQLQNALNFVNEQGRMKFVRPIYRDLYDWEEVRSIAISNYLQNKKFMMHVTASQVQKDLHLRDATGSGSVESSDAGSNSTN